MHYYEIKEIAGEGEGQGLNYGKMLEQVLTVDSKVTTDQFMRLSAIYQKVKEVKVGDALEIEDQDFKLIQDKLEAYMGNVRGVALAVPAFSEFIKSIKEMPTKNPKLKLVETPNV